MTDTSQGPGWWEASDDKWYPPEEHPSYRPPPPTESFGTTTVESRTAPRAKPLVFALLGVILLVTAAILMGVHSEQVSQDGVFDPTSAADCYAASQGILPSSDCTVSSPAAWMLPVVWVSLILGIACVAGAIVLKVRRVRSPPIIRLPTSLRLPSGRRATPQIWLCGGRVRH